MFWDNIVFVINDGNQAVHIKCYDSTVANIWTTVSWPGCPKKNHLPLNINETKET